ncbi:MAG: hypothetical protein HQ579_06240 [Candidatus Omnitrophica bacterium]|nr:hypothetical protein [Candidatus Omnitrophota bacterium]
MNQQQVINANRDAKDIKQIANESERNWVKIVIAVIGAIAMIIAAIITVAK